MTFPEQLSTGTPPLVHRYPLIYFPRSTTALNRERLPAPDELAGMELAYRETPALTAEAFRATYGTLVVGSVLALLSYLLVRALAGSVATSWGVAIAVVVGLGAVIRQLWRVDFSPASLLAWTLGPVACVSVVGFLPGLGDRLSSAATLSAVALAVFAAVGAEPFRFYREWQLCDPRLRPEVRCRELAKHDAARSTGDFLPDLTLLGLVLGVVVLVPQFSPSLALLAVLGLSGRKLFSGTPTVPLKDVLALFYLYGDTATAGSPGTWIPKTSIKRRRVVAVALAASLFLALAVGLSLFFPWDVLRGAISSHYDAQHLADVYGKLRDDIFGWMLFVTDKSEAGEPQYMVAYAAAVSLALTVPPLVLAAVTRRPREHLAALGAALEEATRGDERPEWQWYADRVRASEHEAKGPLGESVCEREHLFLGVEPFQRFPVLLDKKILAEHCYMVGESGSGKTSMGVMPIALQLIRGEPNELPPPMVVLDLKGDTSLFHTLREEVSARRFFLDGNERTQDFLYFTTTRGHASHRFNPFTSFDPERRTLMQLCQLVLDALDLNHGAGYGRAYYTGQSRHVLSLVMEHVYGSAKAGPKGASHTPGDAREPVTFRTLKTALRDSRIVSGRDKKDAFQLLATIEALSQYEQLVTTRAIEDRDRAQVIHMPRLLEERQVAYFSLSAIQESITVREVGQLALFALVSAAIDRKNAGLPPRQAYLIIDEFQRIASRAFEVILEQARQFGVAVILANQTQGALNTPDIDLRPTVRTNTRAKMFFAVSDPREVADLVQSSGEELAAVHTWGYTGDLSNAPVVDLGADKLRWKSAERFAERPSESWADTTKPRLTPNDIAAAGDHPLDFILHVSRGSGYTQFAGLPLVVRTTWPLSEAVYREREGMPWPKAEAPAQVVAAQAPEDVDRRIHAETEAFAAEAARHQDALRELSLEVERVEAQVAKGDGQGAASRSAGREPAATGKRRGKPREGE